MVIRHSPIVVEIFSTCFTMPWLLYHMQCAIILASAIYFSLSIHMIHFPNLQSTMCSRLVVARSLFYWFHRMEKSISCISFEKVTQVLNI